MLRSIELCWVRLPLVTPLCLPGSRYEELLLAVPPRHKLDFVRHVQSFNAKVANLDVEGGVTAADYVPPRLTVWQEVKRRFPLLAMLMLLQSFSSFILRSFSSLIEVACLLLFLPLQLTPR